jgi:hypothetical protein
MHHSAIAPRAFLKVFFALCMHNDAHRVMAENLFAPRANHVLYNDLREDDRELHGARFIVKRIAGCIILPSCRKLASAYISNTIHS